MNSEELSLGAVVESVRGTTCTEVVGRIGDIHIFGAECWVGAGERFVVSEIGEWVIGFGTDGVLYQIESGDFVLSDGAGFDPFGAVAS